MRRSEIQAGVAPPGDIDVKKPSGKIRVLPLGLLIAEISCHCKQIAALKSKISVPLHSLN